MDNDPSNWTPSDGTAFAQQTIDAAKVVEKRPLYRSLSAALDFPLGSLGPLIAVINAIQQRTQAPLSIVGQSVLAAITLAVQAQRNVLLPAGGIKPLTGIFVSIAESGERKSSVDRLALAAVYRVESEWRRKWELECGAYRNSNEIWDYAREQIKRANKTDQLKLRTALEALGPEPKPPPHPMLLIADPTPEGLIMHLSDGRPFAGVFTAEGGQLIGGAAFTNDSKMRTAALFNSLWDGDPIRRKRIGTGSTYLTGRRCSFHIMLQPVIADDLFGNPLFDGIGLTARMLTVAPVSTAGNRLFKEPTEESGDILKVYDERIRHLLMRAPITDINMPDALDPPVMYLHPTAKAAWVEFHDKCESAVGLDGPLYRIKAFAGKLAEHAGRLAAVLTLYSDPDAVEVPLSAMESGISLAIHYANEMLRLADGTSIPNDLRVAQRLLIWWRSLSNSVLPLSYVYQNGPQNVRTAQAARSAIKILEEHGWVERVEPGTAVETTKHKEVWRLIP